MSADDDDVRALEAMSASDRAIENVLHASRMSHSALVTAKTRMHVTRMYLLGTPLPAIAEQLSIAIDDVRAHLKEVEKHWRDHARQDFNLLMGKQLARIDMLEMTYWEAWYDSRQKQTRTSAETRQRGQADTQPYIVQRATNILQPAGDANYLLGVQWCIEQRAKLLGLYAPTKIAQTTPDGSRSYDPISNETRVALLLGEYIAAAGLNAQSTAQPADNDRVLDERATRRLSQ